MSGVVLPEHDSTASRVARKRRYWMVATAAILVAIATAIALTATLVKKRPDDPGPLTAFHYWAFFLPGHPGPPYVWSTALLGNPTGQQIILDKLSVQTGKLRVVELDVTRPHWDANTGMYRGWPPYETRPGDLRDPHGAVIPAHTEVAIFGELMMPRPGRYLIGPMIRIKYHIGGTFYRKTVRITPDKLYTK